MMMTFKQTSFATSLSCELSQSAKVTAFATSYAFENIDLQWFAAEEEGRTEEPSEYKLERARREEGRVPKSGELASAFVLVMTVATLIVMAPIILRTCLEVFRFYFTRCTQSQVNDPNFAVAFVNFFFRMVLPIAAVGAVGAVIGNLIQTRGFIFSLKPIEPKFSKIIPKFGEYFKKTLFSLQGVFNIAKSIVKLIIMTSIAVLLIRRNIPTILMSIQNGLFPEAVRRIAWMGAQLLVIAALLFVAIAIPDFFVQKHEFRESMKMTKQEQKEEYKELEGDPEVKGRLQQMQYAMLQQNIPRAVAESDVVITNPTHFAVALKYDKILDEAPKVAAKGADNLAFMIKRFAKENDVPIVENKPIARALYAETEIGDIIPEAYLKAIAVIYSHILSNTQT